MSAPVPGTRAYEARSGAWWIEDDDGRLVATDADTCMVWLRDHDDRRCVAADTWLTADGDEVKVSTVFLGLNIEEPDEPALPYETLALISGRCLEPVRYASRAEATAGHAATRAFLAVEYPPVTEQGGVS